MIQTPLSPDDPLKSVSILVVEDQAATRGWICDMLRNLGLKTILTANDGVDALAILKDEGLRVDVVLCDWMMPRMSGIELLRKVRQTRPDMPFIMQTGHGTTDAVLEAKVEGVSAFVVKPFSYAQLEVKLRLVIGKAGRK